MITTQQHVKSTGSASEANPDAADMSYHCVAVSVEQFAALVDGITKHATNGWLMIVMDGE